MFDTPRGLTLVPSRLRTAVLLSVAAHAALLVVAVLISRPVPHASRGPEATVIPGWPTRGVGGRPTAAPPAAPPTKRAARKAIRPRPEARPAVDPPPSTASATPSVPDDGPSAETPGVPGDGPGPGGPGGCVGGDCPGNSPGGGEILSESAVAALPLLISGPPVRLSASAQGLGGTMQVVCVITVTGTVSDCEIQQGAPLAEAAVLAALRARTYYPAQLDGRPVAVRHRFVVPLGSGR